MKLILIVVTGLLLVPLLAIPGAWFAFDAAAFATLRHQWQTVLPEYAWVSLLLGLGVAAGVALLGTVTAALVSLFEFPGRRFFEWALLLPLAMPAYVLAYAYTDTLQTSGWLQAWLRDATGLTGALWPDVRSLPGAIALFVLCLYPYVYLLVRAALQGRAATLLEAGRLLGAGMGRRVLRIALPMSRPAVAAGLTLAVMEALADYGVGSYFGLSTFTTGIYKAWLSFGDRIAAAQLATLLLAVVALLAWAERRAQSRMRFSSTRGQRHGADARAMPLHGGVALLAALACTVPLLLGFVVPVAALGRLVWLEVAYGEFGLPWDRFAQWGWTSVKLAAAAAALAAGFAMALAFALRVRASPALRVSGRVISLGYAVPGAVIAVGLLLPTGWLQQAWPDGRWGTIITGTAFGLLYAYMVRFSAVALQSIEAGYSRIPHSLDDSARMLGVGAGRLFVRVHLPLLLPPALSAALLVFVDVMKELPATLALRPFDTDTLAVVAHQLARDERLAEAALPSLAIVVAGLLPVILLARAIRRPDAAA